MIVHEDRKAPVVAVSVWYNVGSKDEPTGKTGFAHLFEHLMFNGSENLPDDYFTYTTQIGATDLNGTTSFDRTNYFQTVPKAALEKALFMESDRMGYLLGAVTQAKLDNQRGVVQNEKRQGDNRPGGLVQYELFSNLFPAGHPYHHTPIGSMADLDAASLADVQKWFTDNYGPNNAVLVLAGDINAAEARPLVQKYFGAIKRGPVNTPAMAAVPTLPARKTIVMKDRVAGRPVSAATGRSPACSTSRPRRSNSAARCSAASPARASTMRWSVTRSWRCRSRPALQPLHRVGLFQVQATVSPGVDPALVEKRLDEMMADFIAKGPTARGTEPRRDQRSRPARIRGLEQVGGFGGKAVALAEGQLYRRAIPTGSASSSTNMPGSPRRRSRPRCRQWLTRPPLTIRLEPGDRPPMSSPRVATAAARASAPRRRRPSATVPPVGSLRRARLPDGPARDRCRTASKVTYAQRTAVPVTTMAMTFDAGLAADAANGRGSRA